jgi:cyclase
MLKKRLVGVVTVKNGWAVQSFGYKRYLPLGKPECLVENLDRWGADEIMVQVIDRSSTDSGPDFKLLKQLGELGLGTPLIYAGGIRSLADGVKLVQLGADRVVVDALMHDSLLAIRDLSEILGAQALIASLPLSWQANTLEWFDYRHQTSAPISGEILDFIKSGVVSEVLVTDWQHEGTPAAFDQKLVDAFPLKNVPLIAFGGLSRADQMRTLLQTPGVSAVAVGNFLSYREHAIQEYKAALTDMPLRIASYESNFPMIADINV